MQGVQAEARNSILSACFCAGVVGQVEPNIPKAGTVDIPNPSAAALEKQPIAKVTVDGDVTANSIPSPPGESQPRN